MRIAIIGAGGVGGYFGVRLAEAGEDVHFIARGRHLAAMRENGLKLLSPAGDALLKPVSATDNPAEIGPVDVVLFSVKLYDTESAAKLLPPLLKPDTVVISLQNGIDSESRIGKIVPVRHVAGGVAQISATIEAPGVVRHHGLMARMIFGEMDGRVSSRLEAFLEACRKAKVEAQLSNDIQKALWQKFIMLVPLALITGLAREPLGKIVADPETAALIDDAVREVAAVGKACGIALTEDDVERTISTIRTKFPPETKASLAFDLERGNRIEIEGLCGVVVRLGRDKAVPTPINRVAYGVLKLHAEGKPA